MKGATVNRELECLKCMLDFAVKRKYIAENPAAQVKHFNELRERPTRRMLTLDEERRILDAAPPHLRVAIILLSQTGGRTYSEGFSLRWSQVDFDQKVIRLDNNVKPRIGGADTTLAICVRRSARMEAGIVRDPERVRFSEPSRSGQADLHGENCLEGHAQESSRAGISDLQLASRVLYSAE